MRKPNKIVMPRCLRLSVPLYNSRSFTKSTCRNAEYDQVSTNKKSNALDKINLPVENKMHLPHKPLVLQILGKWEYYGRLARVDKPIGTLLLLWPCWWSTALAAPPGSLPDFRLLTLFGIGAFTMRSAGCVINDLWDKEFDKRVERTKDRPLASGKLSVPQAMGLLTGSLTLSLGVLLSLNVECIKLGLGVMPLVVSYPLMKRFTWWPQAVLGLTMNWGALIGWTAVQGTTSWMHVIPLYAVGVSWTMVYDTLYGHQDKKDDRMLGLKSTSLLFGNRTKPILGVFSAVSVCSLVTTGVVSDLGVPFYLGSLLAGTHLFWQVYSSDLENPQNLLHRFQSNRWFGAIVMLAIMSGKGLQAPF